MNDIYILLGANLGSPIEQLELAKNLLIENLGLLHNASSIYQSEAWGIEDQPIFYNQVLHLATSHDAISCLDICQQIENKLGRTREIKWGARLIDIDILYFNNDIIESERLHVPHRFIPQRNFTLVPLCEIAPNYLHPQLGLTNNELLVNCSDKLKVFKIEQ